MPIPEKYSHIDFTPPEGVQKEAEKGLAWRREHGRGGTAVGIARARDLSNGTKLSPSTVRRMKAFFDRHEIDKKGKGWAPGDDGFPSNGRIAWALWGSDAGWAYARKVVEQMNAADDESRGLRPYGSSMGLKPTVCVVHGPPSSKKAEYVAAKMGSNDVVFDYQKIMSALSGDRKNDNLISYCTDIRTLIIEKAIRSPSVDKTWIITTRVKDEMRHKLSDVHVSYVYVDTPKDECLREIEGLPNEEELRQVIEDYFAEAESRYSSAAPNVERRFLGNFAAEEKIDPELLRVEKRADPATGKQRTYVVGYAARFGTDSLLLGDFVERIDPSAFDIVEERQDSEGRPLETRCLFNHDPNHLLGRFPTTMRLSVDAKGLRYECLLPESRSDLAESIERGDLRGSSFSFVVAEGGEKWSYENGRSTRLVTKIKSLLDCGPVTYPAYGDSTVAVAKRSYEAYRESRGFCPTGKGGGVDNSCGAKSQPSQAANGASIAASSTPVLAGTATGAALGAIAGLPGAIIGGFTGLLAGAVGVDRHVAKVEKALKSSGTTISQVDSFAKAIGKSLSVSTDSNGLVDATGDGVVVSLYKFDKSEAGRIAGKVAMVKGAISPESGKDEMSVLSLAKTLSKAGKSLGVDHLAVTLEGSERLHEYLFEEAGFTKSIASDDATVSTMIRSYRRTSKRHDELAAFLADKRSAYRLSNARGSLSKSTKRRRG